MSLEIIAAFAGVSFPFFILILDIQRKLTKLVTIISMCPNCPHAK